MVKKKGVKPKASKVTPPSTAAKNKSQVPYMADGGNWIQGAIQRPGAFTAKAKKAGKGVQEYAQEKKGASGRTGKQARLALTLGKMNKKG